MGREGRQLGRGNENKGLKEWGRKGPEDGAELGKLWQLC